MGSCFSKGSGSGSGSGGNFRGEGHVLGGGGSTPAAARPAPASSTPGGGGYGTVNASASSSVPPNVTTGRTIGGSVSGGRTLGGVSEGPRAGEAGTEGGSDDPKSKAAQAAMVRSDFRQVPIDPSYFISSFLPSIPSHPIWFVRRSLSFHLHFSLLYNKRKINLQVHHKRATRKLQPTHSPLTNSITLYTY